jgi:hypothetical protein
MSLIGKIFAVLNILAAVAFVVVAGMDWGQRQRWAYAVYRHDLFVEGLPIDAQEPGPDGTPRVSKLTDATLAAILPGGTGDRVKTQEEEARQVQKLVKDKIDSPEVPGTRSQKVARYVRPLARTADERNELTALMTAPQNDEAAVKWEKRLAEEFEGVRDTRLAAQQRKDQAARLIFLLRESLHEDANTDFFASPAYKRFVNVVGLSGAAKAADDQSLVLQQMTEEAINAHAAERADFLNRLDQTVYDATQLSDAEERQRGVLKTKDEEVATAKALVDKRKVEIDDLMKLLGKLRQTTAEKLADQARAEQEVMERLIDLRDTGKKNQDLEKEIRRLEGVPDRP